MWPYFKVEEIFQLEAVMTLRVSVNYRACCMLVLISFMMDSFQDKSKLDWDSFKQKEGIDEELKIHNRGKDG